MSDMSVVVFAYKKKYGDVPPLAGLSSEKLDLAVDLLEKATKPFTTATWYAALGVKSPPPDALI